MMVQEKENERKMYKNTQNLLISRKLLLNIREWYEII